MLNIRISHCTDGQEKVIEISDRDVAAAFAASPAERKTNTARFIDNGDGTVTDSTTGLMWSKDNVGDSELNHADATKACADLKLAGHSDWRLPTRAELLTLVDDTRHQPAIDVGAFPSCKSGWYWSATAAAWNAACAWLVHFDHGAAYDANRSSKAFVRAVRVPAGQ
jgi:hypothetical protein